MELSPSTVLGSQELKQRATVSSVFRRTMLQGLVAGLEGRKGSESSETGTWSHLGKRSGPSPKWGQWDGGKGKNMNKRAKKVQQDRVETRRESYMTAGF